MTGRKSKATAAARSASEKRAGATVRLASMLDELAQLEQAAQGRFNRDDLSDSADLEPLKGRLALVLWAERQDQELHHQNRTFELAHRTAVRCERQAAVRGWLRIGAETLVLAVGFVALTLGLSSSHAEVTELLRLLR